MKIKESWPSYVPNYDELGFKVGPFYFDFKLLVSSPIGNKSFKP